MSSNLNIHDDCIKCGTCLSLGYEFLTEQKDGSIGIKDGTFLKPDGEEFMALCEVCPVKAFAIDTNVRVESKKEQLKKIIQKLQNWPELKAPKGSEIPFDESRYSMNIPFVGGNDYK